MWRWCLQGGVKTYTILEPVNLDLHIGHLYPWKNRFTGKEQKGQSWTTFGRDRKYFLTRNVNYHKKKRVSEAHVKINQHSNRNLHTHVHGSIIHNSQKVEITQMSINRWWINKTWSVLMGFRTLYPQTRHLGRMNSLSWRSLRKWQKQEGVSDLLLPSTPEAG